MRHGVPGTRPHAGSTDRGAPRWAPETLHRQSEDMEGLPEHRHEGRQDAESVVVIVKGLDQGHEVILNTLGALYKDLFNHDGYGQLRIEMRFLKKRQKEVIIHCGKDYRFVVDFQGAEEAPPVPGIRAEGAKAACGGHGW